jgi:hypothetical protein
MDQYRDLGMREHLDRLAAEDDRGDAVASGLPGLSDGGDGIRTVGPP